MTPPLPIRAARRDECAKLTSLALRSKASWGYSEQFMADCVAELTVNPADLDTHRYFVMESGGEPVAFCALLDAGERQGELADVFVEPARQGEGHGRRLVEHAKRVARESGWRSLRVEADPNARDFYLGCGGRQIGTVPSGSIAGRHLPLIEIPL